MGRPVREQGPRAVYDNDHFTPSRELQRLLDQPFVPEPRRDPDFERLLREPFIPERDKPRDVPAKSPFRPRSPSPGIGRKLPPGIGPLGKVLEPDPLGLLDRVVPIFLPTGPYKLTMPGWELTGRDFWENTCNNAPYDMVSVRKRIEPWAVPIVNWGCFPGQLLLEPGEEYAHPLGRKANVKITMPEDVGTITFGTETHELNDYKYGIFGKTYERNAHTFTAPPFEIWQRRSPAPWPAPDPNLVRELLPGPRPDPWKIPELTAPAPLPESQPMPEAGPGVSLAPGAYGYGFSWSPYTGLKPHKPADPGKSTPDKGRRNRKLETWHAKLRVAIFRAVDVLSEGAEVVDAFFDALPKDVKKRWNEKCGRKSNNFDGDQVGQYGIDNADCKLRALYYNWHKVDMNEAVQNLLANAIEDTIVGNIERRLPRQSNPVTHDLPLAASDFADWLVETAVEVLKR